jgi:hypothetical protein
LAGCAGQRETYAVLPDAKGSGWKFDRDAEERALRLNWNGAYASAVGKPGFGARSRPKLSEEEIKAAFAEALSARPDAPQCVSPSISSEGSDELTPDSAKESGKSTG